MKIEIDNISATFRCTKSEANRFESSTRTALTVEVPGAKYTWDFKNGGWDGKTTLWEKTEENGEFIYRISTGLAPRVMKLVSKWISSVVDNRGCTTPVLNRTQINLRDYQYAGVNAALGHTEAICGWWPRGVIKVATGGGKTEMAVAMYEMNSVPTMFLVHRKDLMIQAAERFKKYSHQVGTIGDSKFNPSKTVTIATMQTLHKIISCPGDMRHVETMRLILGCKQVFFDETHLMASTLDKGNMFVSIANEFTNATCRWGLTATPFMRGAYDNLLLEAVTGDVLYEISNADLIERGFLTPPRIRMIKVPGKNKVSRPPLKAGAGAYWRAVWDACIRFHPVRNKLIVDEILKGGGPTLCLVTTIDQGTTLQNLLKQRGEHIDMLSGQSSMKERKAAVKGLQSGAIRAIICTTIWDEGMDIPALKKIILASGGKSQVKLLQRLGRGLRLHKNKKVVEICDYQDGHHEMVRRHALERLKRYREEGFEISE